MNSSVLETRPDRSISRAESIADKQSVNSSSSQSARGMDRVSQSELTFIKPEQQYPCVPKVEQHLSG